MSVAKLGTIHEGLIKHCYHNSDHTVILFGGEASAEVYHREDVREICTYHWVVLLELTDEFHALENPNFQDFYNTTSNNKYLYTTYEFEVNRKPNYKNMLKKMDQPISVDDKYEIHKLVSLPSIPNNLFERMSEKLSVEFIGRYDDF